MTNPRSLNLILAALLALPTFSWTASAANQRSSGVTGGGAPRIPGLSGSLRLNPVDPGLPPVDLSGFSGLNPVDPGLPVHGGLNIPGALPAAVPAAPAPVKGPVAPIAEGVAPHIEAISQPGATADGSAAAGEQITTILQGGKAQGGSAVSAELSNAGAPGSGSGLSAAGASNGTPAAPAAAPAPQKPQPRKVEGASRYGLRRAMLAMIASVTGAVYSLPQAGPKLTERVLAEASDRRALLSDIDDTLGKYNTPLPAETVAAIAAYRKAGKTFGVITDRPDKVRAGSSQLSAFDTMNAIPAADRPGIIVATNGGGKIYEYDAQGEPKLIFEEPPLDAGIKAKAMEAGQAVMAELEKHGTALDKEFGDQPYGYGMSFRGGTPEATVNALAARLQQEYDARGVELEVEARMAKDPSLPPYITSSKLNKSLAVKRIAELKKLSPFGTVLVGDSMYKPRPAAKANRLTRLAERLSGAPMPLTGNATDRNMELGLKGAMTISVGGTADPRISDGWVIDGKGPEATRRLINAMAQGRGRDLSNGQVLALLAFLIVAVAGSLFALYSLYNGIANPPVSGPNEYYPPFDINDIFR